MKLSEGQKLHHILEYLCTERKEKNKGSCDTAEIANSFNPPLKVAEVNTLCRILLDEGDIKDCSTCDNITTICILYLRETQDAYEMEKYLTEMDKISYNFNLYIRTSDGPYNILDLEKEKLQIVIDAYINGKMDFVIKGEKYNLEDVNTISIYTYEKQIESGDLLEYCINKRLAKKYFYDLFYLEPETLALFGKDVTEAFLGDNEYGSQIKIRINDDFVSPSRIDELKRIRSDKFDLTRLIQLCKEINDNYKNENYLSVGMIGRTILHHIPPIFGYANFDQVVSNAQRSLKYIMERLKDTKCISDRYLHQQIRDVETLPTKHQVDFIKNLDVLLEEIIRELKKIK